MDKSNEILFNESALNSLKRAQLVALCKRYDIKQSGKNEDLVGRLQFYAQSLLDKQKQTSNVIATDYATPLNDVEVTQDSHENARTSQQWEIVEDGAEDVIMSNSRSRTMSMRSAMSISTFKSLGSAKDVAIGSVSSKGSGSVSSSLMSIASSLKRAGSKSSKSSKMSTSSSRTTSTTDSIVKQPMAHLFPPVPPNIPTVERLVPEVIVDLAEVAVPASEDPDQDSFNRPIAQGVVDASKLLKEQSTIRLVTPAAARLRINAPNAVLFATPNLKPFNLAASDPKEDIGNAFLAMDDGKSDIGNAFLAMDGRSFTETTKSELDASNTSVTLSDITTQGISQDTEVVTVTPKKGGLLTVSPPRFVFGSPANAVSNAEFGNAAAAVLEEMNKRLGLGGDAPGAVKLGVDGTIDFGELTPSGKSTLNLGAKKGDEGRFGRVHEKVFGQMSSIADHYAAKRPPSPVKMSGTLAGTKRKSTAAFEEYNHASRANAGKRVICLDDPKDKATAPPPPKRQRVDGADLAKMEKTSVTPSTVKDNEAALKKAVRARRSSKGRSSMAGSVARRRSVAPVKVAPPSGRFGLLRSGAAKVMKTILSTVSHQPQPAPSTSKAAPAKASAAKRAGDAPSDDPSTSKSSTAPKAKPSLAPVAARPSTLAPRASAAPRKVSQATMSSTSTRTSFAPKAANASVVKTPKAPLQRGSLPVFEVPIPASKDAPSGLAAKRTPSGSAVAKRTSVASRASVTTSTAGSRRPSVMNTTLSSSKPSAAKTASIPSLTAVTDSQTRRVSRNGTAASKITLGSVQEGAVTKAAAGRNPDFEPAFSSAPGVSEPADGEDSRPASPLPAPPASLSSRPLQRRQPLEPLQVDAVDEKGSVGRRPRISRSKVIAKVHANRLGQGPAGSVDSSLTRAAKGRKSGGVSMNAKAKLMGGEGVKGRASIAAAEAAKRKARASGVAGARRRTMAQV